MAILREKLTKAGFKNVRTYIQSGNAIVESNLAPGAIEKSVHDVIQKNFGGDLAILARTSAQLQSFLKKNPFAKGERPKQYFTLLAEKPPAPLLKEVRAMDFSPDEIVVKDDIIYLLTATKYSDSKFNNNWFERKLKVSATTRNLNTMEALIQMAES